MGGGSETIDGPEGATSRHLVGDSHRCAVPGWRGEGAGKPRPGQKPTQLFASDCSACHKSPQTLAKAGGLFGLDSFLRTHYTASRESATAIANYLKSLDTGPASPARASKRSAKGDGNAQPGDRKRPGAKPGEAKGVSKSSESKPPEAGPPTYWRPNRSRLNPSQQSPRPAKQSPPREPSPKSQINDRALTPLRFSSFSCLWWLWQVRRRLALPLHRLPRPLDRGQP